MEPPVRDRAKRLAHVPETDLDGDARTRPGSGLRLAREWLADHPGPWQIQVLFAAIFTYVVVDAWINSGPEAAFPHLMAGILVVIFTPTVVRHVDDRRRARLAASDRPPKADGES